MTKVEALILQENLRETGITTRGIGYNNDGSYHVKVVDYETKVGDTLCAHHELVRFLDRVKYYRRPAGKKA